MHITEDESVTDHLSTDVDNPLEDSTLDNGLEENYSAPIDDDEETTEAAEAVPEDSTEGHVVAAGTNYCAVYYISSSMCRCKNCTVFFMYMSS